MFNLSGTTQHILERGYCDQFTILSNETEEPLFCIYDVLSRIMWRKIEYLWR